MTPAPSDDGAFFFARGSQPARAAPRLHVQRLDLFARPRRAPQELQARRHAGVMREAADGDQSPQPIPAMVVGQAFDDVLQGGPMQGIVRCSLPIKSQTAIRRELGGSNRFKATQSHRHQVLSGQLDASTGVKVIDKCVVSYQLATISSYLTTNSHLGK